MEYLTLQELATFWRSMTEAEEDKASKLIEACSAEIRLKAKKRGKDFDELYNNDDDLKLVTKSIISKVVAETMNKDVNQAPYSQFTETAGGYSLTGTYYSASMGTFFTKNDWKRLGLGAQMYGGLELCQP